MIGDSCQQWSCIECVIKKQEYEDNLRKLEQRFLVYKQKLILSHELIRKYKIKCKENENLQEQQRKSSALLKEYQNKLINSLSKQTPLEKELEEVKKAKVSLEEKLELEASCHAAMEKHNFQLNNLVQQLEDGVTKYETKIGAEKEAVANLTRLLKKAKARNASVEKRRLKTMKQVISFAEFVQKEGRLAPVHKRMLTRWQTELGRLVNGEADFSEDEGIFSPEVASSCSSRDTGLGSIAELLSDDDHTSVISESPELNTSSGKDQSAAVSSDVTCKSLTLDHTKKTHCRNSRIFSSGSMVPLNLGSDDEIIIRSNGIQVQDSSEIAPVSRTKPAGRNASSSALASQNSTYVRGVPTKNMSEVDHLESSDGNLKADPALVADQTSGVKSAGLPLLFDPDIPLTPSRIGFKEEKAINKAVTDWDGGGVVPIVNNSDCKSSLAKVESPVDTSLYIKKIMEEMRNVPNLMSPMTPDPETVRSLGKSNSSSAARTDKAEMRDASTLTYVLMLDAAVGVDEVAELLCHAAVQTGHISSYNIACQTSITTYNTCTVQTDVTAMLDNAAIINNSCAVQTDATAILNTAATIYNSCATQTDVTAILDTSAKIHDSCAVQTDVTAILNTAATIHDSCAVQTDVTAIVHAANNISHPEGKFISYKSPGEETTCSIGEKQKVGTKLSMEVNTEAEIQTPSGVVMNDNLMSYAALLKGTEKENFLMLTLGQNSTDRKCKKRSSMVRCDYMKPEKCLKEEVKKWESLVAWLCSNKSDDSFSDDFVGSKDSSLATPTMQSSADKPSTRHNIPASSGSFAVEVAPHASGCLKEVHPDECTIRVASRFHCPYVHMDPLLCQPHMLSCGLAMQSMDELSNYCCYRNTNVGAYANMCHSYIPQAAYTHQGQRNHCCCCISRTNSDQSNHRPPEREVKVQISSTRSTSDKSAKRLWKRIVDTEDSSSDLETGSDHKMPSKKMCLKNHVIDSTSSTEMDSEVENTCSRRRGIFANKQDSSVHAVPGRKVATKQLRKRREVTCINGRDSLFNMDSERENNTAKLGKIKACLKENQTRGSAYNEQEDTTYSRIRKRKKCNGVQKKDLENNMSKKTLRQKFSLSKLECISRDKLKHLMHRQQNEHIEESDTPIVKLCKEVHVSQHEAVECTRDYQVGSCDIRASTVQQSNTQQKTEENINKHSLYVELFGTVSDEEQQSGKTVADMQTIQPGKVSGTSLNNCKRKASDSSSGQVGSRSLDMQKPKRAKIDIVNEESGDTDSEAASSILLLHASESRSEKYVKRTYTDVSLPSQEQPSSNQEFKFSAVNEKFLVPNGRVNAHGTGQAIGKTDAPQGTTLPRKSSKLEKLRRNLIRAKMPAKIAIELPEKHAKRRKILKARSETNIVGSNCNTSGVRSLSEMARDGMPNLTGSVNNLPCSSPHHNTVVLAMEHEKPSTELDTTTLNLADSNNSVADLPLTCNSAAEQILSTIHIGTGGDVHTETNHTIDIPKIFASTDTVLDVEIPACSQDRDPIMSYVTEGTSPVPNVDHAPEIRTISSLPDKVPKPLTLPTLPISYKEVVLEVSQFPETMEHVTFPHTYHERENMPEIVTKVESPDTAPGMCQAAVNFRDVELPATVSKVGGSEDVVFSGLHEELIPCPVSPIKNPEIGELHVDSETIESSIRTLDTIKNSELPMAVLSIESPVMPAGSSMYHKTGEQITMREITDKKLFPGCVLQWVLKDYEVKYKKKHPKKSKSLIGQLKEEEAKMANEMKRQEKIMSKKEVQELLSSCFSSGKLQQLLQKLGHLNSESASLVLAKIIIRFVSDDTKAPLDHSKKRGSPPLTTVQQRLVTLVFTLQSQCQQYKDLSKTILLGIECQLFRLGRAPDVARICSLARFYTAMCLVQQDRQRVQAFCYDAMYCLHYKAFPVLFTVYITYPDALPHADVGKDILLVMTMTCLILMQSTDKTHSEYRIEALKNLLQTRYGYGQRVPTNEQLLRLLVDRLRNSGGHIEGLEASLILLAKRMGWDRSYRQLLCRNLIPLLDEWRAGAVSDLTIREVIVVIGYVTRCFPVVEAKACVQAVLNLLGTILLDKNVSTEVQEAAASSLLRLSRHNFFYVTSILLKWQPRSGNISDSLLGEMLLLFEFRNPKWWHTILKRKHVLI